ncbi:MAG: efflux RND transporter periplasmic adaptor subunit [Porphyromonas sp.]|nr:efflux RND transporter periplasmic adaptor subunit [Porphyromonas sp.]
MDIQIPKEALRRERRKKRFIYGSISVVVIAAVWFAFGLLEMKVAEKDLTFSYVDRGSMEVSVGATGVVVPAFEERIVAPINSRIEEVYVHSGDLVDRDTPLLRLNLKSIQTEYGKMLDEERMRCYRMEQERIESSSKISNAEIALQVNAMKIDKMATELRNEKKLDSIGAGTMGNVREAQLRYDVALLEHEQSRRMLSNDKRIAEANRRVKELELSIFRKNLSETERILNEAQIRASRRGIVTYINSSIGAQVVAGADIAILSDLSHFCIEGRVVDALGDRLAVGSNVVVVIGRNRFDGHIATVNPLSKEGFVHFSVQLLQDDHPRLRSGLKCDVHIMYAAKVGVLRIKNGPYYTGRGKYDLFVERDGVLYRRAVVLGDSNYEYVEVESGLEVGERVVTSDMRSYLGKTKIKMKKGQSRSH